MLFVCTENVARSPLAAALFLGLLGGGDRHLARSAGTASGAPRRLTTRDMAWAEVVAVMEDAHLKLIQGHWPDHANKVVVLGVPDYYGPDEPELRALLAPKIRALLDDLDGRDRGAE